MPERTSPESASAEDRGSLSAALFRGTTWMVAMRWSGRLLGLLSTAVLARVLAPGDFGLVAMATAAIALAQMLTDFGVEAALLANKDADKEHFDTAWTVRQIQMAVVSVSAVVLAPLAADYYGDPRVTDILRVIAISVFLGAMENIGVVNFRKHLQFDLDFKFNTVCKALNVAVTIGLALWFRSYWALALGMLAGTAIRVTASYVMSPYRPRWSFAAWNQLWGFSQWMLTRGLGVFIFQRVDVLFLGGVVSPTALGHYSVSQDIAELPVAEISAPVGRAVVPGLAQISNDGERLRQAFKKVLSALAVVTLPIGIGIALVAHELVALVLGDQWSEAVPLLQALVMFAAIRALVAMGGNLFLVLGYVKYSAAVHWSQALTFLALMLPVFRAFGILGLALLKGGVALFALLISLVIIVRITEVRPRDIVAIFWRPMVASIGLLASVLVAIEMLGTSGDVSSTGLALGLLAVKSFIGATVYTVLLLAGWQLSGQPDGIERMVVSAVKRALGRDEVPEDQASH